MNKLEFLKLIANAPKYLKGYTELLNYARNAYKQIMGVFPEGIDNITIKQAAKEASDNRRKIVQFPGGGKDKTDFFTTRPDPRVKQPPGAKMDVQRAHENISGGSGYAQGDTKYNADVLAEEIARQRKLIPDDGIADTSDLDFKTRTSLYDEAYSYLTQLRRLNRKPPGGSGGFGMTILDDTGKPVKTTTGETPESLMKKLVEMTNKNLKDRGLGSIKLGDKIPPPKNKKPAVDPELQAMEDQNKMFQDFSKRTETEAEMLERMNRQNKEAVKRLKEKKIKKFEQDNERALEDYVDDAGGTKEGVEFDDEPFDAADGGRIGFGSGSVNAVGLPGNQVEQSQPGGGQMEMPRNTGFQPIFPMPQKNIPGSGGIKELRQFLQAVGAPELGMGYNFPVGQSGILGVGVAPSGNVGAQLKIPLSGGRFGFKDGSKPKSPGRRTFIKTMAGLASLPFVGKLFKPAAKVAEAGPAIAEGVKLGFDKFMMLVDKIKRLGRKTDRVTQTEREEGFIYTGKDGSQYELVEDLATGDLRITKDKPGVAVYGRGTEDVEGIDVIDDRSTFYLRRNQADETTKGRKPPDEYDEVRELPDEDGTFTDIDEVSDNTVNEVLEELGETRTKKAGGGLAYMLGE